MEQAQLPQEHSDPATHFILGHVLYSCVVSKNHALLFLLEFLAVGNYTFIQ